MPGLESSPDMLFIIKKKEVCAMPALQCSAVKCMYNKDNLCSKGDIQVKGDHAATENETWCSSFAEKTGMSNAYTCGGGCSSIQVGCAAHDCTYNRQEVCQADHVHIDGSQACICEETCCGTFRCE